MKGRKAKAVKGNCFLSGEDLKGTKHGKSLQEYYKNRQYSGRLVATDNDLLGSLLVAFSFLRVLNFQNTL